MRLCWIDYAVNSCAGATSLVGLVSIVFTDSFGEVEISVRLARPAVPSGMTSPWPYGQFATRALDQYWSDERLDHFATSTAEGAASAVDAGYTLMRTEGTVLGGPTEHTVPLRSYVDPEQGDHLTVCSPQGVEDARVAGYQPIRIEGHVFLTRPSTPVTPLRLYASGERHDNLLSGTAETADAAEEAGYGFVRTEGFAPANVAVSLKMTRRYVAPYARFLVDGTPQDDELIDVEGTGFEPHREIWFHMWRDPSQRLLPGQGMSTYVDDFGYRLLEVLIADDNGRVAGTLGREKRLPGDLLQKVVLVEGYGVGDAAGMESPEARAAGRGSSIVAVLPDGMTELLIAIY